MKIGPLTAVAHDNDVVFKKANDDGSLFGGFGQAPYYLAFGGPNTKKVQSLFARLATVKSRFLELFSLEPALWNCTKTAKTLPC